jgi:hypothetical protein
MINTNYRIIGYGHANYGFFNQFNFSSTLKGAEEDYQRLLEDPEMDGAVVIEVNHEDWRVINEFGNYPVSVIYSALGTFKVQKAPNYVII